MEHRNEDQETKTVIGENTPIKIGLIIAFLGIFGSGVWWASSITSKLDSILASQNIQTTTITELKAADMSFSKELSDIKLKLALDEVELKVIKDKTAVNASDIHHGK